MPGRRARRIGIRKRGDGAAERVNRVGRPEVASAMPPRSGNDNLEAPAGQRLGRIMLRGRAIQDQIGSDSRRQLRLPAQVPHPAQVALAFLPHIGHQQQAQPGIAEGPELAESH